MHLTARTGLFLFVLMSAIPLQVCADSKRYVRFLERTINEYKTYKDMEVLVITVPDLTKSMDVFFDLEAVNPTNCKTLSIDIYYEYGAPPLPPGQTFTNKTYLKRTLSGSEARTIDDKKPLSFMSTLPGLWYIGVLVPQSNGVKRISDLGFGNLETQSCSFNVSARAELTLAEINSFIPSDGGKIRDVLHDDPQTKYYRYQHIRKSSSLIVIVSGCYLLKDDGEKVMDVCPLTLAIRRKILPNKDYPSTDCFSKDPCDISMATPEQQESDYFISTARIPHMIGGSVYYNISIYLNECSNGKTTNKLKVTDFYPGCVAVQKMFAVATGKVFNKLFYPNQWNSSVTLHSNPQFFSVTIPPSHVGAVLSLQVLYFPSSFRGRGVVFCLQKDYPAGFYRSSYYEEYRMNCSGLQDLVEEDGKTVNKEMVIPFPETGIWYISIYQQQSYDYTRSFTIHINAELQGCINNCNSHGTCGIHTKPDLVFGTCDCDTRFNGWACEKEVAIDLVATCLLCLSNLVFIADVIIAVRMKLFPEMVVYMFLAIMSSLFHLCQTHVGCVMEESYLQLCDFFAIILSIWVTLIAMTSLSNTSYTATLNMITVLVLFVSVVKARESIFPLVLTVSIGLVILVVYHVVMWLLGKQSTVFNKKRWALFILPASILITLSIIIFSLFETVDQYKYVHSIGHVFVGIGIGLLLPNHRHRISHYDVSRQLSEGQSVNSRTPLLIGQVRHV